MIRGRVESIKKFPGLEAEVWYQIYINPAVSMYDQFQLL